LPLVKGKRQIRDLKSRLEEKEEAELAILYETAQG
jgi:hypothetical protein